MSGIEFKTGGVLAYGWAKTLGLLKTPENVFVLQNPTFLSSQRKSALSRILLVRYLRGEGRLSQIRVYRRVSVSG